MSCGSRQPGTPWAPQLLPTRSPCWQAEKTEVGPRSYLCPGRAPPSPVPARMVSGCPGRPRCPPRQGQPSLSPCQPGAQAGPRPSRGSAQRRQEQPDGPVDRRGVRQEAGRRPLCCRQTQWGLGGATRLVSAEQSTAGGVASIRFSRFINCRAVVRPRAPAPAALTPEDAGKPPRSWAQGR